MNLEAYRSFSVEGKVIVITGGAGFLGKQYAEALIKAGAHVVIWDQKPQHALDEYANLLCEKNGVPLTAYQTDITVTEQVQISLERTLKQYERIDALINNAALNPAVGSEEAKRQFAPYEEYPMDLWKQELDINLTGMMNCTQAVAPTFMRQRKGVVLNIASELSVIAYDHRIYEAGKFKSIAYIATKTGVLGLTRAWAARLGEFNVRVNAFSPGGVQTANHPQSFVRKYSALSMLGRMAQIGEYNGTIIYLCSDASSFMTGMNIVIDGGKSAW